MISYINPRVILSSSVFLHAVMYFYDLQWGRGKIPKLVARRVAGEGRSTLKFAHRFPSLRVISPPITSPPFSLHEQFHRKIQDLPAT
jgi:hypothetical protein